ncbi:MAG: hypothetical protein MJ051_04535 [Akkermansia sp.]|nr:hypothetical protein [Akkermansia sp.]
MRTTSDRVENEAQLLNLLAELRVSATPEADFEERFLYDFHEAVAREAVCCPAHRRLFEHLAQFLYNFGMPKLAFGASSLGVAVVAVGLVAFPGEETVAPGMAGVALHRFESSLTSLTPGMARDFDDCTSIHIAQKESPFAHESVLVSRHAASPDVVNVYTSSAARETSAWDSMQETTARGLFAY